MSKLERLLKLTALLLETPRALRVDQIGELMEDYPSDPASFRRAFERDKDDLREMGIPIELISLDPSDQTRLGYRIDPDRYYLRDPGLNEAELEVLRLAAGAIRLEGAVGTNTFRKLGGVPDDGPHGSDTPSAAVVAELPLPTGLETLYSAIGERRVVAFRYNGAARDLEPHRLDFRGGHWYVSGHDRMRQARRCFRLDRIEGTPRAGEPGAFVAPAESAGLLFEPWRFGDDPPVTARVAIDADHAYLARAQLDGIGTWDVRADGSAIVELAVTDRVAFRDLILGFLDHATILEPTELRDELVDWLRAMAS